MIRRWFLLATVAAGVAMMAFGNGGASGEAPAAAPGAANGQTGDRHNGPSDRLPQPIIDLLKKLAAENPQAHRELMELHQKNPTEFRARLYKLMQERGLTPRKAPEAGSAGLGQRLLSKGLHLRFLERFQQENPGEFERLSELKAKDPERFRQEIRKLFETKLKAYEQQNFGASEEARRLAQQYRAAATPEEKERLLGELRQAVRRAFEERGKAQQQQLEQLQRKLEETRRLLEQRQENRDLMCEQQVKLLLKADGAGENPAAPPGATRPTAPEKAPVP